jgi:hypothetical protein
MSIPKSVQMRNACASISVSTLLKITLKHNTCQAVVDISVTTITTITAAKLTLFSTTRACHCCDHCCCRRNSKKARPMHGCERRLARAHTRRKKEKSVAI